MKIRLFGVAFLVLLAAAVSRAEDALDRGMIERLTGMKGSWNEKEKVFRIAVPRADLAVVSGGVRLTPAMGLTSWAAFQSAPAGAMVMGDLVLREDQVVPVMDAALQNGLEVTALHNHFLGESPRIMYMHIAGMGDAEKLAAGVGRTFDRLRETGKASLPAAVPADIDPARTTLDPKMIEAILGTPGDFKDGVLKVVIAKPARMQGSAVGAAMGVNTWAAFAGSDAKAVVDGDFAMLESELQGVLKALRRANIQVVAIHSHMTGEEPRVLFLHYWGIGTTEALARGLRAALDTQAR
jgi:uncharacterized protein DUF1259